MISSPLPISNPFKAKNSASVPLPTPKANFDPVIFDIFFSNSFT